MSMRQRPPNLAPHWIALALGFCIGLVLVALYPKFPAGALLPQAREALRDLASLHPPGEQP